MKNNRRGAGKDEVIDYGDALAVAKLTAVRLNQMAGSDNEARAKLLINCLESAYAFYFLRNRKTVKVREMPPNLLYCVLNYLYKEFWQVFAFERKVDDDKEEATA